MKHWRTNLYIIWFAQILSLMSFGFGIPFLPFYIQQLGVVDPDKIKIYTGLFSSATGITLGIMAPIWGMLADKMGKKPMLLRAILSAVFILGAMGLVSNADQLVVLKLIQGAFTGTITASAALVASNTPEDRLSYALGFLSSSTFIGYSLGPVIGGFIAEYVGYRISFFIGGALMLVNFILVQLLVKEDRSKPVQDNQIKEQSREKVPIFTPVIISMLVLLFFIIMSRSTFSPYIPLYVQMLLSKIDGAARTTGIISGAAGLMTAASGMTLSRLGDKYDKGKLLKIFITASLCLSIPLIFIRNLWVFAVFYSMFFFAIGGIEPVIMSVTSRNIPSHRRGVLFGVQALVGSIGWAFSPLLGSVISIKFSIPSIIILMPVFLVLALVTTFLVKNKMEKIKI